MILIVRQWGSERSLADEGYSKEGINRPVEEIGTRVEDEALPEGAEIKRALCTEFERESRPFPSN